MKIEEEILINQYGQYLISENEILIRFNKLTDSQRKEYLLDIIELILQSKPKISDIEAAIESSQLRSTYTSCVLLVRDGIKYHNLKRIADLPLFEQSKSLILFLNLFRVAYQRRYKEEKTQSNKWWYSDLSDEKNVEFIQKQHEM